MTLETVDTDQLRDRIGRFGVWRNNRVLDPSLGTRLEALGFGALWIGGTPGPDLEIPRRVLEATETLTVATGIVSIWSAPPETVAAAYHRLAADFPGRFVLGLGVSHPEHLAAERAAEAARPYEAMVAYLDGLDAAGVPEQDRMIAALGPRMVRLAGERSAGAHPYLVTPTHSRESRGLLGPSPVLAPEQRVVLHADPEEARAIARESIRNPYLGLSNYRASLSRLGFSRQELDGASDRLVDALSGRGSAEQAAARLVEHLDAGADHVAVQLLTATGEDPIPGYEALARALGLTR